MKNRDHSLVATSTQTQNTIAVRTVRRAVTEGHEGCASAGTDARVGSTVRVRVRHVIDRGGSAQSARHLVLALVSESESNSRLLQGAKGEYP